ncbi:Type 1 glutamine amidotransferase-like domain-containing protein [Salinivibrio proteolyticus]|uniref:Peptidase E n=1 Tax=Salinivibrio proteolyticus TaxID=334715 RepID=A0ABY7LIY5_9GAMM|nr:peptidase E [Salinivibrio proteolyticus]WBA16299.1 peptidase E [Salinivibrio proteolyticus]
MDKHIVALGGGGWMMGEQQSELDQYALRLTGKSDPKVCYIPTATGDAEEAIDRFYQSKLSRRLSHFPLFKANLDWRTHLQEQDVIYVGGGNTRSMLAVWKAWGIDKLLQDCYESGIILCGMSAGAICWFDYGITDSDPEKYSVIEGLSFVQGLASAHYPGSDEKAELFSQFANHHINMPCYGISDYSALHFVNGRYHKTINSQTGAQVTIKNVDKTNI